jgi:hypothetical protein
MNKNNPDQASDEITLVHLWNKLHEWTIFIWSYKYWILLSCTLFSALGFIKVQFEKPKYCANLTFSLDQGNDKGSISGLASQFGLSIGENVGGMFTGENLIELLKSRRIVEDVLLSPVSIDGDSVLLIDQFINTSPRFKDALGQDFGTSIKTNLPLNRVQDSVIGVVYNIILTESLQISKREDQLSFVTISYIGSNEEFAGAFVELLTNRATDYYIQTKMANSTANIAKLEQRVDSVSAELQAAMVGYASSQDQNSFTVQSTAKVPSVQKQMKVTMLTTLYGELVKNLELSKTMAAREEPLITVIDRPHYPLRVRESKLKSAAIGGVLGVFLTLVFLGARAFIQDLNKQAAALKQEA